MALLWICLILFLLYYLAMILFGLISYPKLIGAIKNGNLKRTQLYCLLMAGQGVWVVVVLLLVLFGRVSLADVGLGLRGFADQIWLVVASAILAGVYFVWLVLSLVGLRQNAIKKVDNSKKVPERTRAMFPVTKREKRVWIVTAIVVGIAEELLFRGFLFYLLGTLFPGLPLFAILIIVSLLFGAGHLYQGPGTAVQPALIGLLFGIFYIAFGSILPCIVLHVLQDLGAVYAVNMGAADESIPAGPKGD
jgi:uncharacterized protein